MQLRRITGVLSFALLTAVGARLSVPIPGIAVPLTLQVVAVLLAGVTLGSRLGASSQLAYLAAGAMGLPVFAAGGGLAYLLGPTGGYLLAFPVAAAIAGRFASQEASVAGWVVGLVLGLAAIHAAGLAWLAAAAGKETAVATGLVPFLVGDALKLALVFLLGRRPGSYVRRLLR